MTVKRPIRAAATPTALPMPAADYPVELLRTAAQTIIQRGQQRDTSSDGAAQERSMAACVAAFNAIEGTSLTERQGWAFMATLKLTRAATAARNGQFNADDYVDGAAYNALGAEAAERAAQ